ncbi:hypothetical protein [Actinoplanes sp. L3-i22]|uniref:hypothetical protein n=1 Tax=Actinoplanes sp. L3-i22 TaxID=2836373 RepID=UPI001C77AC56|nr:hypothetical protein [Actinoplanes sp. L3-i22]BCY08601.1 hypothetical protein L3i22_036890 [Actinoplanes sp. L3-i22]
MDQLEQGVEPGLPDLSTTSLDLVLHSENPVLAYQLRRIEREMQDEGEILAAGFQSAL